ncbi:MAG: enolase C-terminal domain-like protein [Desulfobacterales bacterium]
MHLDTVVIHHVKLPFSFDFSHSLRKRSYVNNIIVEIIAEQGKIVGYGEGAPRSYVTGESIDSTVESIRHFVEHKMFPRELIDISQIWNFIDGITIGKEHNSAICALETALLDALGKNQNRYIRDYFSKDFITDSIHYGAAIPLDSREKVTEMCRLIKTLKINTLRLKLGKNLEHNKTMLETVRLVFENDYDLRVDINCGWDNQLAVMHIPLIQEYNVKAIEQPMMPDDPEIADFAQRLQQAGVILMADESACSFDDIKKIVKENHYKMINIRLSKCGGFKNSLKMIDYLRSNGVSFQIGCQLGESGVLSAAGRILCLLCRDAVYYDGSYDQFLLEKNVTSENVSFYSRGKADPLNRPGLGVSVSSKGLKTICCDSTIISSFN